MPNSIKAKAANLNYIAELLASLRQLVPQPEGAVLLHFLNMTILETDETRSRIAYRDCRMDE